jgi:hypothetical protein
MPLLYARWMPQLLAAPIPQESQATCADCAMCRHGDDDVPQAAFFDARTKCCTYVPAIPNFLVGAILIDTDPDLAHGRTSVAERIARRVAVSPWGLRQPVAFKLVYGHETFGRAPAIRCPHYVEDYGGCGIWKQRPGVCATWFCKHVRGEVGLEFWTRLARLLREVESELALWCVTELQAGSADLSALLLEPSERPDAAELDGPVDDALYRRLWGSWIGREAEFYAQSASLVQSLEWHAVANRCGPRVRMLASQVGDAYAALVSDAIPERLTFGRLELLGASPGSYRVASYSPTDPLQMSAPLLRVLPHFDGRAIGTVMEEIRAEHGATIGHTLLRRLVDFGILKEAGRVERQIEREADTGEASTGQG